MQQDKIIEGEVVTNAATPNPEAIPGDPLLRETARFIEAVGKGLITVAENLSSLMVIQVDGETRERLDMLVEAGVAKSRRAGAQALLAAGIENQNAVFAKIESTRVQISALKAQLRTLAGARTE